MKHPDLERYLRLATWGLWGPHKQTVRRELESHIRHKAWKYQITGLQPSEAIARALSDLGPPHVVSAGMNGVYTMPNLVRNTLLCAVLATLGVGNLTSGMAQVVGTTRVPIEDCAKNQETFVVGKNATSLCDFDLFLWLKVSSLQATLEAKGVEVSRVNLPNRFKLILRFPGVAAPIEIDQESDFSFIPVNSSEIVAKQLDSDYIDVWNLIRALTQSGTPVTITGLNPISVTVGKTSFTVGTEDQPVSGKIFLFNALFSLRRALESFLPAQFPGLTTYDADDDWVTNSAEADRYIRTAKEYRITVKNARENDKFIIVSRENNLFVGDPIKPLRYAYLIVADKNGFLEYRSPSSNLRLVEAERPGAFGKSGEIAVLKFTGQIGVGVTSFERVPVADITIQPVR
jgi:hypothetical protein